MQRIHRISVRWFVLIAIALMAALAAGGGLGAHSASASPAGAATPVLAATSPPADAGEFRFSGRLTVDGAPAEGVAITVTGTGFDETVASDADGNWAVPVPAAGDYQVSIDLETLPEGFSLRDPAMQERTFTVGNTSAVAVLFPIVAGEGGATGDGGGGETQPPAPAGISFQDQLIQRLVSGFNFGLLLAIAAIGITLIFGTTGVTNFAHGELLTFGGFMLFVFSTQLGWPTLVAAAIAVVLGGVFGYAHDAAIFKPLRRRRVGLIQVLVVTIALSISLRYFFQFIWGGNTESIRTDITEVLRFGPINMPLNNVIGMGVAIVVLALIAYFLTRTRVGKAARAVSDNSSLASASGINVDRVIRIVWILAGASTALSGVLYSLYVGSSIRWDTGFQVVLLLFSAVTLGGLGSPFGALVGAMLIGIATEVSTLWIPPDLRFTVALAVLILILLVRPQGILGRKERIG